MLPAENIIIRPPVEAYSVLIPVTGGCSWNQCRFCGVYKGIQDYSIRPLKNVIHDIHDLAKLYPTARNIFLAGGNPTSAPPNYLISIITEIKKRFMYSKRISSYAKALDILKMTGADLRNMANAGLTILYMGLESGSDIVLKLMKKGNTARSMIKASKRIMDAGIDLSLYVILGLGGLKYTDDHALETARVLNEIKPTVIRFRTLNIMDNAPLREDIELNKFKILSPLNILKEQYKIILNLDDTLKSAVFNDHISNYVNIHSENIGEDKKRILSELNSLIEDPSVSSWKHKGLKTM